MKRKTAKRVAGVLLLLMFVLFVISRMIDSDDLLAVSILLPIAAMLIEMKFDRCPYCAAYLGRCWGPVCPHCHHPLVEDK